MSDATVDLTCLTESDPRNHPLLEQIARWLSDIILGEEASRLLDNEITTTEHLHVRDVWLWREPRMSVGRKAKAGRGQTYRLPIRVTWPMGHLVTCSGHDCRAKVPGRTWRASGMGWDLSGTTIDEPQMAHVASPRPGEGVGTSLRGLVEQGQHAKWNFLLWLQPTVAGSLHKAHAAVRAELSGPAEVGAPLVDEVKIDQLRDQMLFGDDDYSSSVDRLIVLCCRESTFRKVDPLRYIMTAMRRDASIVLRRALGDPHVGRKVRHLARELGTTDPEAVVEAYRKRWPTDHLAPDRARAALSVGPDVMASWRVIGGDG